MRLLLDEMIGPRVARELRDRGLDVAAAVERTDLRALPDDLVLEVARDEERVLVTLNIADFARLHQQWLAEGRTHHGIVMVPTKASPQDRSFVGALITALEGTVAASAVPGRDQVHYLRNVTSS